MATGKQIKRFEELENLATTRELTSDETKEFNELKLVVKPENNQDDVSSTAAKSSQNAPVTQPLQMNVTSASIARDMVSKSPYKVPAIKTVVGMIESLALIRSDGYNFERDGKIITVAPSEYAKLTVATTDDKFVVIACNDIFLEQIAKDILGVKEDFVLDKESLALSLSAVFNKIPTGIELKVNECKKGVTAYYKKSTNSVIPHGEDHLQGLKVITLFTRATFERMYNRSKFRERLQVEFSGIGQAETQDASDMLSKLQNM